MYYHQTIKKLSNLFRNKKLIVLKPSHLCVVLLFLTTYCFTYLNNQVPFLSCLPKPNKIKNDLIHFYI